MVNFTDRSSVYYYRNPYNTVRQTNQFYNDNFGVPIGSQQVYNPTAYNYYNPPVGVRSPGNATLTAAAIAAQFVPGTAGNIARSVVDTAAVVKNVYDTANYLFPNQQRLSGSNLPPGADYVNYGSDEYDQSLETQEDTRVIITDPTRKFVGGSINSPLQTIGGVLFPYTPSISFNHKANYDTTALTHSNYEQPFYVNSAVDSIQIQGTFTANNTEEAKYVLAVIHFFRSVTKMFYGQDSLAGTPPPVLFLDGYGKIILNHIPVVITDFNMQLPDNVDYISTAAGPATSSGSRDSNNAVSKGSENLVPTELRISVNCKPTYSRNRISNNFGLEKYVNGQLLSSNKPGSGGPGGFI
jgi:hypothetical protein